MALVNVWHLRKVAENSAKPCDICYKPTPGVLITPDNKDYFYICQGHLKDRGFASPIIDEADIAAKKQKEELNREIEAVKKEYDEKMKSKKSKQDSKKDSDKAKEKDNADAEEKKTNDEAGKAERERDDKIETLTSKQNLSSAADETPRIYALQKYTLKSHSALSAKLANKLTFTRVFFQKRVDRIRNAEIAKRNRERLKSPNLFPSVPTGNLG